MSNVHDFAPILFRSRFMTFVTIICSTVIIIVLISCLSSWLKAALTSLANDLGLSRKKMSERKKQKRDAKIRSRYSKRHAELHKKVLKITVAQKQLEMENEADLQKWIKEQEVKNEENEKNQLKDKAKRTRENNIRRFRNLFGCRPIMIRKRENRGHIQYWQDVHVGLARIAARICQEQMRVLRRFPTKDELMELKNDYEDTRLLVKRYCRELYDETRPWAEQIKSLMPRPPKVKRNKMLTMQSTAPVVEAAEPAPNGRKRRTRKAKSSADKEPPVNGNTSEEVLLAEVVDEVVD